MSNAWSSRLAFVVGTPLACIALATSSCGDEFSSCYAHRTCPSAGSSNEAGTGGDADPSSEAGSGGDAANDTVSSGGSTGGSTSDTNAEAGMGGSRHSGEDCAGETGSGGTYEIETPPAGGMPTGGAGTNGGSSSGNGGGGVDGSSAGVSGSSTPPSADTTPPTVVSISPPNGAEGITSSTPVEITFSEAMDRESVQNALSISSFSNNLNLAWSSDSKTLTISANGGFPYAEGNSRNSVSARAFTVSLTTAAQDAAGNALGSTFTSSFLTLRRINATWRPWPVAFGDTYGPSLGRGINTCEDEFWLGSWSGQVSSGERFAWIYVDGSSVGDPNAVTTFELARITGEQVAPEGAFYPDGSVLLQKQAHAEISNALLSAAATNVGVFSSDSTASPTMDITNSFWSDLKAGKTQQLFRLKATGSALDTFATFTCNFSVTLRYLLP